MAAIKYSPGLKFNKLTLVKRLPVKLLGMRYEYYGLFRCDCGEERMIKIAHVVHNKTKSCGCLYKESNSRPRKKRKT